MRTRPPHNGQQGLTRIGTPPSKARPHPQPPVGFPARGALHTVLDLRSRDRLNVHAVPYTPRHPEPPRPCPRTQAEHAGFAPTARARTPTPAYKAVPARARSQQDTVLISPDRYPRARPVRVIPTRQRETVDKRSSSSIYQGSVIHAPANRSDSGHCRYQDEAKQTDRMREGREIIDRGGSSTGAKSSTSTDDEDSDASTVVVDANNTVVFDFCLDSPAFVQIQ